MAIEGRGMAKVNQDAVVGSESSGGVDPKPTVEHFRGSFESIDSLLNAIKDPKAGDYAVCIHENIETLYFYGFETKEWVAAYRSNYRGIFTNIPYIPNSQAGDYILLGELIDFNLAIYNPYLGTYVEVGIKNADRISEGVSNLFYRDSRVKSLLISLFSNDLANDYDLKNPLDAYINKLIAKEATNSPLRHLSYTIQNSSLKTDGQSFESTDIRPYVGNDVNSFWESRVGRQALYPKEDLESGAYFLWEMDFDKFTNPDETNWIVEFFVLPSGGDTEFEVGFSLNNGNILDGNDVFFFRYKNANGFLYRTFISQGFEPIDVSSLVLVYKNNKLFIKDSFGRMIPVSNTISNSFIYPIRFFARKVTGTDIGLEGIRFSMNREPR